MYSTYLHGQLVGLYINIRTTHNWTLGQRSNKYNINNPYDGYILGNVNTFPIEIMSAQKQNHKKIS